MEEEELAVVEGEEATVKATSTVEAQGEEGGKEGGEEEKEKGKVGLFFVHIS